MKKIINLKLLPYIAGGIIVGSLINHLPIVSIIFISIGLFLLIASIQTQINTIQK